MMKWADEARCHSAETGVAAAVAAIRAKATEEAIRNLRALRLNSAMAIDDGNAGAVNRRLATCHASCDGDTFKGE